METANKPFQCWWLMMIPHGSMLGFTLGTTLAFTRSTGKPKQLALVTYKFCLSHLRLNLSDDVMISVPLICSYSECLDRTSKTYRRRFQTLKIWIYIAAHIKSLPYLSLYNKIDTDGNNSAASNIRIVKDRMGLKSMKKQLTLWIPVETGWPAHHWTVSDFRHQSTRHILRGCSKRWRRLQLALETCWESVFKPPEVKKKQTNKQTVDTVQCSNSTNVVFVLLFCFSYLNHAVSPNLLLKFVGGSMWGCQNMQLHRAILDRSSFRIADFQRPRICCSMNR